MAVIMDAKTKVCLCGSKEILIPLKVIKYLCRLLASRQQKYVREGIQVVERWP